MTYGGSRGGRKHPPGVGYPDPAGGRERGSTCGEADDLGSKGVRKTTTHAKGEKAPGQETSKKSGHVDWRMTESSDRKTKKGKPSIEEGVYSRGRKGGNTRGENE